MSNRLIIFFIAEATGMAQVLLNKQDPIIIMSTATLMAATYLLFMGTLPKETNMISYFMSEYSIKSKENKK